MGEYCVAASTPMYLTVRSDGACGFGGGFECGLDDDGEVILAPNGDVVDGRRETAVGTFGERVCGEAGA